MDDSPLVGSGDRFPLGLPGHAVPISSEPPSHAARPWGMNHAVLPAAVRESSGKHHKPTSTRQVPKPTEYTDDSETRRDTVTETVTD